MRVRIVKNLFPKNAIAGLNLSNYIGIELPVYSEGDKEGSLNVIFPYGIGIVTIYKGEYEIIKDDTNIQRELDNYFRNNQREYNFCNDDVVDFLIEHRDKIVEILM